MEFHDSSRAANYMKWMFKEKIKVFSVESRPNGDYF
jgi:hypothetical protein